jgi:hypothetical protein
MINTTNGNGNGLVSFKLTNYTSQNPPKWAKHRNFFPNDQTCVFVKEITDKYQSSSPAALSQPTPIPVPPAALSQPTPIPVPPAALSQPAPIPVPPPDLAQPTPTSVPPTPTPTPTSNSPTEPGIPTTTAESVAWGNSLKANAESLINDFKVRNGLIPAPTGSSSNNTRIDPA